MTKNEIIEILNDNSTNINEQQNGGVHKAVYCNYYEKVADAILRLHIVTGSIGRDTKPLLRTITQLDKDMGYFACDLCRFKKYDSSSDECSKCQTNNEVNQYYL